VFTRKKTNLIKAAALVHETMKKIDEQGTAFGLNRIAVMAALNIANDAITGSADMATKIRTEYDVELDLQKCKKSWKLFITKLKIHLLPIKI